MEKASELESEVLKKEVSFSAGLAARHTANIVHFLECRGQGWNARHAPHFIRTELPRVQFCVAER